MAKTKFITIRVTIDDHQKLRAQAQEAGLKGASDFVKKLCEDWLSEKFFEQLPLFVHGYLAPPPGKAAIKKLIAARVVGKITPRKVTGAAKIMSVRVDNAVYSTFKRQATWAGLRSQNTFIERLIQQWLRGEFLGQKIMRPYADVSPAVQGSRMDSVED